MSVSLGDGGLLRQSLALHHRCGRERHECVVLWLGSRDAPEHVTRVVHPRHTAKRGGYVIDPLWLEHLWGELADRGERIVAQVHTHPGRACHSSTDDRFPIVWRAGLYSVVIPEFARPPYRQTHWYLTRLQVDGTWSEQDWKELAL